MALRNWFRPRPTNRTPVAPKTRLGFVTLEDRAVPSATFDSVLGIGSDTNGTSAYAVATDAAGNSYMTGSFGGTVDFDPVAAHPGDADVLTARGSTDIYVAKYSPENSLLWARRMGGDHTGTFSGENGGCIEVDPAGNVYVGGSFRNQADFGSITLTSAGHLDGFVAKLNASGTVLWAQRWGGTTMEGGDNLAVDGVGNLTIVGSTAQVISELSFSFNGSYIQKFSANGTPQWSHKNAHIASDVAVDATGNIFVAGSFDGTVDFDPSSKKKNVVGSPNGNGYVMKLKATGTFEWVSPFIAGSTGRSDATTLDIGVGGNIVVGGSYSGPVDFNPGNGVTLLPVDGTTSRPYVAVLTSVGNLSWAKALAPQSYLQDLAFDGTGAIYLTGTFTGSTDFDPGTDNTTLTSLGLQDCFVAKLTVSGEFEWALSFGGILNDQAHSIVVGANGDIFLAGSYRDSVDFDPDPNSIYELHNPNFADAFLIRLKP